jgi:hypothetical protein
MREKLRKTEGLSVVRRERTSPLEKDEILEDTSTERNYTLMNCF